MRNWSVSGKGMQSSSFSNWVAGQPCERCGSTGMEGLGMVGGEPTVVQGDQLRGQEGDGVESIDSILDGLIHVFHGPIVFPEHGSKACFDREPCFVSAWPSVATLGLVLACVVGCRPVFGERTTITWRSRCTCARKKSRSSDGG